MSVERSLRALVFAFSAVKGFWPSPNEELLTAKVARIAKLAEKALL
jgi:hypothetical protein